MLVRHKQTQRIKLHTSKKKMEKYDQTNFMNLLLMHAACTGENMVNVPDKYLPEKRYAKTNDNKIWSENMHRIF